jgi:hypothetical protein
MADGQAVLILFDRINNKPKLAQASGTQKSSGSSFSGLLSLAIFIAAIYLSWTCNTNCEPSMGSFIKGLRAFGAGMFGWMYLIVYFLFWSTGCNKCVAKPM